MSHSLNEIEAMSKKAARGVGMSWGMAEEAGRAVRWLTSHELPGTALLADLLDQNDGSAHRDIAPTSLDGVWHARSGTLCPIIAGAALNDCADRLNSGASMQMSNVSFPLLAVPFAAWAAIHVGQPVAVSWGKVTMITDGYGLDQGGREIPDTPSDMSFEITQTPKPALSQPLIRGTVCDNGWTRLQSYAHRTYAPATESSRLLGAGAGTSDND